MERFRETIESAVIEFEGGKEYVIAEDTIQDNFYFRFDFETGEIGMCSHHQLSQDQQQILIDRIYTEFQEEIEHTEEEAPFVVDYHKMYGTNESMFI